MGGSIEGKIQTSHMLSAFVEEDGGRLYGVECLTLLSPEKVFL